MWVKICANTSLEDALLACEAGADAVGFVFAASPRRVTAAQVAEIAPHLPLHVERVGVFTDQPVAEIVEAAKTGGLNAVQVPAERAGELLGWLDPAVRVAPVLHWIVSDPAAAERLAEQLALLPEDGRVLVDSKVGKLEGGSGVAFDWAAAATVLDRVRGRRQLVLAGGLKPANVAEAAAALRPWGVDVASGVEAAPGRKDAGLVKAFVRTAKGLGAR